MEEPQERPLHSPFAVDDNDTDSEAEEGGEAVHEKGGLLARTRPPKALLAERGLRRWSYILVVLTVANLLFMVVAYIKSSSSSVTGRQRPDGPWGERMSFQSRR